MATNIGTELRTLFNKKTTGAEKTSAGIKVVLNTVGIPLTAISGLFSLASKFLMASYHY
jgi:hypothetical protein